MLILTINNGNYIPSSTNKAVGLLPFEGEFKNLEDENDIIEFTIEDGYGTTTLYNNNYCYVKQINKIFIGDGTGMDCTYTTDTNGNVDTITIDNVAYEKVTE